MKELLSEIPDVEVFLALQPEELAGRMLFWLRRRPRHEERFHLQNLRTEVWSSEVKPYPQGRRRDVNLALGEAWAWLAQGLLVPDEEPNGANGWFCLSRRAKKMETKADFANYKVARLLSREILHPKIAEQVWLAFMRGEFDGAAFHAMKAVEVHVRTAAEFDNQLIGMKLMQEAFKPEPPGPLADSNAEPGERVARMQLFIGAIGCYKNPHSHRDVDLNDPSEALEIILLANHLLRIVDSRSDKSGEMGVGRLGQ